MTAEPIRMLPRRRPFAALRAFVDRYEAMTPEEQRAEDRRWYLAQDARYALEIPRTRLRVVED